MIKKAQLHNIRVSRLYVDSTNMPIVHVHTKASKLTNTHCHSIPVFLHVFYADVSKWIARLMSTKAELLIFSPPSPPPLHPTSVFKAGRKMFLTCICVSCRSTM